MEPEKPRFLRFNSGDKPREPPSFLQEHSACGSLVKARGTTLRSQLYVAISIRV